MIYEIGNYQIRPSESRLDWEIWEYREVKANKGENKGQTRTDWVSMGKYPSTFGFALRIVYELMLKDCKKSKKKPDKTVKGVAEISKYVMELENKLMETVEKAVD